ncbi:MAG: hypothetical protein HY558_00065, partial [Euryarchaeota archaeon]|nr:hypothetical protein [Euryarchaeota archaeon]
PTPTPAGVPVSPESLKRYTGDLNITPGRYVRLQSTTQGTPEGPQAGTMEFKDIETTLGGTRYLGREMTLGGPGYTLTTLQLHPPGRPVTDEPQYTISRFSGGETTCTPSEKSPSKNPGPQPPPGAPAAPPGLDLALDPSTVTLGPDNYTTPTGKTIRVEKFRSTLPGGEHEVWATLDLPLLPIARIQTRSQAGGTLLLATTELQDYGTQGANSTFTPQELEAACLATKK